MGEIWKANPELPAFLENPNVTEEEKVSVLKGIFEERVSPEMMEFLLVILHKGRQKAVRISWMRFWNGSWKRKRQGPPG